MKVETWPINRPIPYARNARKIPQQAAHKVAASIHEFGFRQRIVVDKQGVIVAGHTRLLAAQKLGLEQVPVHIASELSPTQIKAYRVADLHVSRKSRENTRLLTRASEERARFCKPDSQLACVPHGGGPCFSQDQTSICCLEPESRRR